MGMAASQARYLALVARKSNCEYEGQQINQARLLLSNQSANLFNQMLGLSVPVPPSTQDFTKTQYSYTDGINSSVIDSWKQLSNDPEYNYIVSTHYYTDIYTGSVKKMSDPQVQSSNATGSTSLGDWNQIQSAYNSMTAAKAVKDSAYNTWQTTKTAQTRIISNIKHDAATNNGYKEINTTFVKRDAMSPFVVYNQYIFNRENGYYNTVKVFQPNNFNPSSVTDAQSATATANANAITEEAAASTATTLEDAKEHAIAAAEQALIAAENALSVANLSADALAIADAKAAYNDAQTALQNANEAETITDAQAAALAAKTAAQHADDVFTSYPTLVTDAQANITPEIPEANRLLQAVRDQVVAGVMSIDDLNTAIINYNTSQGISHTTYIENVEDLIDFGSVPPYSDEQVEILNAFALAAEYDDSGVATGNTNVMLTLDVFDGYNTIPDTQIPGVIYPLSGYALDYAPGSTGTTNATYIAEIEAAQALIDADYNTYDAANTIYENALNIYNSLNRPTYIGNSELTLLGTLTDEQSTELLQVVKDLKAQGITSHLLDCFAPDGTYLGGVYSFKLNGNTYYTTFDDLDDAYASNANSNNYIDAQYKMPYYNASYISTRVDQEARALLETDESGRFKSIRFENDSVTYTLNMETITDEDAYQDAMNQYYYENAKYDKTVQDINAKTSIIQREDQELELRLKQLDTEQNALSQEIDAVSKVVKDNVESSFKTFGG